MQLNCTYRVDIVIVLLLTDRKSNIIKYYKISLLSVVFQCLLFIFRRSFFDLLCSISGILISLFRRPDTTSVNTKTWRKLVSVTKVNMVSQKSVYASIICQYLPPLLQRQTSFIDQTSDRSHYYYHRGSPFLIRSNDE